MLSYLVQIEPVWNFDSDNSYEVSNQRGKIRKPFEISKAVFDLKLHVIISTTRLLNTVYLASKGLNIPRISSHNIKRKTY